MKVLHVVGGVIAGGAGRGAFWLHQGLRNIGMDSWLLTNEHTVSDGNMIDYINLGYVGRFKRYMHNEIERFVLNRYKDREPRIFTIGCLGDDIRENNLFKQADILHLHWVRGININSICGVDKPIIWTLRDMWPMTGGCHYSMECERYEFGCGHCPQLKSETLYDVSRMMAARKAKLITGNLHIVGISSWITECAKESSSLRNAGSYSTISNGINIGEFYPIDKSVSRKLFNIPLDKNIVLVGAQNPLDFYKGFRECLAALANIGSHENIHVVFFGNIDVRYIRPVNFSWQYLGFLNDIISLRLAYSAADVFVAPSKMEAFGKTLIEAMACGTPVVAFDATGPKDIIDHMVNGYLAKPFCSDDLFYGIRWLIENTPTKNLSTTAREKVLRCFDINKIAYQYSKLYMNALAV